MFEVWSGDLESLVLSRLFSIATAAKRTQSLIHNKCKVSILRRGTYSSASVQESNFVLRQL